MQVSVLEPSRGEVVSVRLPAPRPVSEPADSAQVTIVVRPC